MKHLLVVFTGLAAITAALFSAPQDTPARSQAKKSGAKKVELPHPFYWAAPDQSRGDWQGRGGYVAQVVRADDKILSVSDLLPDAADFGHYQANIFRNFDVPNDRPVVILHGVLSDNVVTFSGDGWTGTIENGHFKARKGAEAFDLQHVTRTPPALGAKPPAGSVVLFDGAGMAAWAKMMEKSWLTEDGPCRWNLISGGWMEVVPQSGSIISRQSFGDARIHVEFRTLGGPTNSGVYIQDRYEVNINEVYSRLDGNPCAGLDNCTPPSARPGIRSSRPPLEWQTLDIDFRAPRFNASGEKNASARATVRFNGTLLYNDRELGPVTLGAARLGEAPTGPIQLQEHGMPVEFRNIWVVEGEKR